MIITVLVVDVRALPTDSGTRHELIVLDQQSSRIGRLYMDEVAFQHLLAEYPLAGLMEVDALTVAWTLPS